jgi:Concanavalin A-like lectin/glucanases superfamily
MTQSFQQLLVTNYGLQPSGYTGSQGVQGIAGTGGGPKISAVQVTNSSGTVLDDTAVDVAGGYVLLTGSGFEPGCQVLINTTPAVSTTFVSATQVRAQVAATTAGTYIVYLVNADGGVAIRINGITFSATPVWVTGSSLSGDSDVAISIQLSAAGAVSYSLAAGSTLPPGLTLSAGGLLSGTVTGLELETVYNFTVNAIDAELQDSPRSFAITISAGDPQIAYVTALLSPDLEVLPFNRDAGVNNFAVSVVGDARPNNFGPYTPGYYSNFFDGTGDYLSISSAAGTFGTGNFTIEGWLYPRSVTNMVIIDTRDPANSADGWTLHFNTDNTLQFSNDSVIIVVSSSIVPANTWSHISVCRVNNTITLYINGVVSGTGAIATDVTPSSVFNVGIKSFSTSALVAFNGYMSNLRVVTGTAVYTADFTPPTAPLTAIANTSLLTCQSNRFVDNSSNNFAITRNGDARIDGFDPFVPATEFAGRGSTYFDGTGDVLTPTANAAFAFGTGAFCIEAWMYNTTLKDFSCLVTTRPNNSNYADAYHIGWDSVGGTSIYVNATPRAGAASGTIKANVWQHYVCCRNSSGLVSIFVDGIRVGTETITTDFTRNLLGIGDFPTTQSEGIIGYISNLRLVKGNSVYDPTQTTITVPTLPLTAIANTSLLTCQTNQPNNNNRFLDSSTNNLLITRNGNTTQGAFSPYGGGWSNYFDGTGDELTVANNAAFNFGSGNFTVECWFNLTADATANIDGNKNAFLFGPGQIVNNEAWLMELGGNSASSGVAIAFQARNTSGTPTVLSYTANFKKNTWYHVAASRAGNTLLLFVDGVKVAENTNWTLSVNSGGSLLRIGRRAISSNYEHYFPGYISNVRVVKGTAVYTANFTPSTAPLQPITGTSLLTCDSNRFRDASTNNFAITRAGDVSVQKFNPFGLVNASGVKTSYTPAVYGGSMYFDGTGDYISNTSSNSLNFGTGAFTVEMWLYANTISTTQFQVAMTTNPQSNGGFQIYNRDINTSLVFGGINVSEHTIISNMIPRQWYHIAISRVSTGTNQTFVFVNGAVTNTLTVSDNYNINGFNLGGYNASIFWHGYISDARVLKGTALYTSSFVPPTAPVTPVTNTTLLLNGTSAAVRDASMSNNLETVGDARVSTSVVKYGSTSMSFDGSGDYLNIPSSPGMAFGSANFTLECWIYIASPNDSPIYEGRSPGNSTAGFTLTALSSTVIRIFSGSALISATVANYANTWTHVAVVRNSGTTTLYVNGISGGTTTSLGNMTNSQPLIGGGRYSSDNSVTASFNGLISDFRITNGVARYTATFTPPAGAFKAK